jgi:hypothetical protein
MGSTFARWRRRAAAGGSARSRCSVAVILGALVPVAVAARATPAAAQESTPRFELTPYAAYRFGGEFDAESGERAFELRERNAQGLIFNVRAADANTQWEALYAHQATEVETQTSFGGGLLGIDVDYLHFGGTYVFDGDTTRPFVALTAGVAHFEPGLPGLSGETYFSASIGGGVQLRATKRLGVRLEGRAFASLVDSDGSLFCASGGPVAGCALAIEGETLIQWEAHAGLVFRF